MASLVGLRGVRAEGGGRRWRLNRIVSQIVAIVGALLLWQLVATTLTSEGTLPTPWSVGRALVGLWGTAAYWSALLTTLRAWAIGLLICSVVGVPVGLALGSSRVAMASTRWVIDFFRTIPTVALLPLLLLLFGATARMEITMIVLAAIWPIIIQSIYSVSQIEPLLKWVVRVFRFSVLDRARFLWVPSIALMVSTGLRLSATMALLMAISAEYIGGAPGLGSELVRMQTTLQRPEVYAYAVTAGLLGVAINVVIGRLQRRVLCWHPSIREGH
ncbi:ABC transporter permease [Nocardioides sp. Iso805N]|uniref:ABC transporter permease n=1 Tax=Nocardioides sp. Iso805N TaxID=1283287 RepID=UPI0003759068|nr:ABC transporter permease subunit [Nocardioides sp. Iso805N]